jgi:integrase
MEIAVLRRMMKRAKVWSVVAEDVKMDRENTHVIGRVLTTEDKKTLFKTAATKDEWVVVYCAAVLAVSTTCRGIELKHLRWRDVDLFSRTMMIRRSKTQAGHRTIPLNADALTALGRLRKQADALGFGAPEHFVFPACERQRFDPTRPQKTWRTAWRSLIDEAAKQAGEKAAKRAAKAGTDTELARTSAIRAFVTEKGARLRFHDLRHQAITELAENGASDATVMALAGHMSREMMEHYSHVRMVAKREAIDRLSNGLMTAPEPELKPASDAVQ